MKPLKEARVAILGLGLMGGSLAAALTGQCRSITACDPQPDSLEFARAQGWVQQATDDPHQAVAEADLVILAAPVRTILTLLANLSGSFPPGCLVMDLGSTKQEIARQMEQLPSAVECLGGHPMCGKEKSGVRFAEASLFRGRRFLLTPLARTSPAGLQAGTELALALGAEPQVVDPARHDRLVATSSHLPYLIACGLVDTASGLAREDPLVWQVAASGFRDTSRLAGSSVAMMTDILITNRPAVLAAVRAYQEDLGRLAYLLENGDEAGLAELLHQIQSIREGLFP